MKLRKIKLNRLCRLAQKLRVSKFKWKIAMNRLISRRVWRQLLLVRMGRKLKLMQVVRRQLTKQRIRRLWMIQSHKFSIKCTNQRWNRRVALRMRQIVPIKVLLVNIWKSWRRKKNRSKESWRRKGELLRSRNMGLSWIKKRKARWHKRCLKSVVLWLVPKRR